MAEAAAAEEYACPHCAGDPSNASAAAAAAAAAAAFVEPGSHAGLPIEVLGGLEKSLQAGSNGLPLRARDGLAQQCQKNPACSRAHRHVGTCKLWRLNDSPPETSPPAVAREVYASAAARASPRSGPQLEARRQGAELAAQRQAEGGSHEGRQAAGRDVYTSAGAGSGAVMQMQMQMQMHGATMVDRLASGKLQASEIAGLRRDSMMQSSGGNHGEMQRRIAARAMERVMVQQQQVAEMQAAPMTWGLRQRAVASGGAHAMGAMPVAEARPRVGLPLMDQQQLPPVTSDTGHFKAYHVLRISAAAALCRISTEDGRHCARAALIRARECYDSVIIGHRARGLRLPGPEADAWEAEAREAGNRLSLMEQQAEEAGLAPAPLGSSVEARHADCCLRSCPVRRRLPEVSPRSVVK